MKKEKILIVDDEADIALIVKLQLEDAGYATARARDGFEALKCFEQDEYSLVLLDIRMPGMDGIQTLGKLLAKHPEAAVIMITAHGSEDIAVESMKKGALDYIAKPFSIEDLLKKVERTLELNRTRRENKKLQQQLDEERKKMEAILQGMADMVIAVGRNGRVMSINKKAESVLGVTSAASMGMPVEALLKTDLAPDDLPCAAVLRTGKPHLDVSYQLEVHDGTIPVLSSATPLVTAQGEIIGCVEILRDISTLKEHEQEKEDFVSMLTHDLKTPLTAVVGSIDLVREGRLGNINEEQKEYLESAMESCAEIVEMIDTLLDVYRFEAKKMVMTLTIEDPQVLIQRAVASFRSVADRSRITLTVTLPDRLPLVKVDRAKFLRLLNNLLSNAFKFTPDGGSIVLQVDTAEAAEIGACVPKRNYPNIQLQRDARFLRIRLADTGIGIPEEALATIFEKFFQARSGNRGRSRGTGLGLAFCRKVMDAHGGLIWAESLPEQGSTFTVLFPLPKQGSKANEQHE